LTSTGDTPDEAAQEAGWLRQEIGEDEAVKVSAPKIPME